MTPATEVRDGMRIDWDVPIVMDDGVVLRADVYRPVDDGRYPVIASMGVYGKNLPFWDGPYRPLYEHMVAKYPEVLDGTSGKWLSWEVVDPEKWVPYGYAIVRIDSRGAGRSEGVMDCFSPRETLDYYHCIEWAAGQPWSTGRVGLSGISYYAMNQWHVACLNPPHLAGICPWEGASDWYREGNFHGGIPCSFWGRWFEVQARTVQHGLGSRGSVNPNTGMRVSGDVDLTDSELAANRVELASRPITDPLDGPFYRERSADYAKITVPVLSTGNWGGQALHSRGNFMGYLESASEHKWLEVHGGEHWTSYYTDYGNDLQRRFFDWCLKGEGDWESEQPRVAIHARHPGERFVWRAEDEWPLARTEWTRMYLDPASGGMAGEAPAEPSRRAYRGFGDGIDFLTAPFERETEITGPVAARMFVSSSTTDADLFLVLRLFDPAGDEVLFHGANEPRAPIAQGWLRASHRKVDPARSRPWQPWHPHDEIEPLEPGRVYGVDVEIWPTSIVVPPGHRLGLAVLGRDFDHGLGGLASHLGPPMRGSAFFLHDDPRGRPPEIYDGEVTIHGGGDLASYLLLPVIQPPS